MTAASHSGVGFVLLGRRGNDCAPQRGGVFSPLGRGRTFAPHISFSLAREKETCRARYKEKERLERLSWRKLLLFRMCLCPDSGFPGAMRTGFTACAAAADRCGWAGLRAGTNGFRCESRFFFLCVYLLMAAPWCYADWFYRLRRCR